MLLVGRAIILMASMFMVVSAGSSATAQSLPSEAQLLATDVVNRHQAVSYVHQLYSTAAWIAYIEGVALVSQMQNWPTEKDGLGGSDLSFTYDVYNLQGRLAPVVFDLKRNLGRNQVFTTDEQTQFDAIVQDVDAMIADSQGLYDLLHDGQVAAAGEFYRNRTRTLFRRIDRDSYTLVHGIEERRVFQLADVRIESGN
ncbi:MAG: hypothetical protein ABI832_19265, partial [bacterium]